LFRNSPIRGISSKHSSTPSKSKKVILVTSGAMACGMSRLGLKRKRNDIPFKQAMAAVGQGILMQNYCQVFSQIGIPVAQILLAPEDVHNRHKYLNARNTFQTLLDFDVLPIVNENDTVAITELKLVIMIAYQPWWLH
jgi:glutamate 5-kinase